MDWIAFALRAYQEGKRPEDILASVPPEERAAVREALEAAMWLRQRAPAWREAVAEQAPSWEVVQRYLPVQERAMEQRAWRGFRWGRLAWALAVVLVVLWFGVSQAAAHALPGQWAYPLKRGWEEARLRLTRDDLQRFQLEMQLAEERLHEAQVLLALGDPAHAEEALAAYQARWEEMVALGQELADENVLRGLEQALARHQAILESMATRGVAQPPGLLHALEVLQTNRARLENLQTDGAKKPDAPPGQQKQLTPSAPGQDKSKDKGNGRDNSNNGQGKEQAPGQGGKDNGQPNNQPGKGKPTPVPGGKGSGNSNGNGNGNGQGQSQGQGQGQGNGQDNGSGNGQGQGQSNGSGTGNGNGNDKGQGQGNNGQGNGHQGQGGKRKHQP